MILKSAALSACALLALVSTALADPCEHVPLTNVAYPVDGDERVPLNAFIGPFERDCAVVDCLVGPDGPVELWQTAGHPWARHYMPLDPLRAQTEYTVFFGAGREATFRTGDSVDDEPPDELLIHEIYQEHEQDPLAFCPAPPPHVNIVFAALHDALTARERLRVSYSTPEEEIVDVAYFPENIEGSYSVSVPQGAGMVDIGSEYETYTVVVYDGAGNRLKKEHGPVEHYGCRCGASAGAGDARGAALLLTGIALCALLRARRDAPEE